MRILLPPSESKTPVTTGEPVQLTDLGFPELTGAREQVLAALTAASAGEDALAVLGIGPKLTAEAARNTRLHTEPAAPALAVYSGVLYDALDHAGMTARQRTVADEAVVVVSALWGAVRPVDRIPAYRLSMGTALPPLGKLATWWKGALASVLEAHCDGHVVVDCRSAAYAAAWKPPAEQTLAVRVEQVVGDRRTVVSHHAKHTRGLVAAHLVRKAVAGARLDTVERVAAAVGTGWEVELAPATARTAAQLTVVLPEG